MWNLKFGILNPDMFPPPQSQEQVIRNTLKYNFIACFCLTFPIYRYIKLRKKKIM